MKIFMILINAFLVGAVSGEMRINGNFFFRGDFKGGRFLADGVSFEQVEDELKISWENGTAKIAGRLGEIRDFVRSAEGKGFLVFKRQGSKDLKFRVVYITSRMVRKSDAFSEYEFTENFDTIVELGGVSKSGKFFLAKGAQLMPADPVTGHRRVQHRWGVFKLEEGGIEEIVPRKGIFEWSNYQAK